MKKELLVIAASLALVSSMNASVKTSTTSRRTLSQDRGGLSLIAHEIQPGDKRHGHGKDDPKGHKVMQQIAREAEPGDDRRRDLGRGRGNDDGKGHKLV